MEHRPIKGYEDSYTISRDGTVTSIKRSILFNHGSVAHMNECVMKQRVDAQGFKIVVLSKKSKRKIHRIMDLINNTFGE
jgi:hypothetical protein